MTGGVPARVVRFRLDPKDATAPVTPPPSRVQAPPATAASPPAHALAGAPRRWTRKHLFVAAVVVLVVLSGGATAVLYAAHAGPFAYPHAYLVEGSSVPSGLSLPAVPADAREEYGITENPGQVPRDNFENVDGSGGPTPEDVWMEVFAARGQSGALTVLAIQYANEDDAKSVAGVTSFRCMAGGFAVLRDGDVVVMVIVGNSAGQSYFSKVVTTIMSQTSGIKRVC